MRTLSCLVILVAALGTASASTTPPSGLPDAAAARSMLGGDTWARLVRIDNANPRGMWSRGSYPRTVYALVFELSGILWFYTDADGTQSLSLVRGTLERDEADPGPLFRAIDPGFTAWSWVKDPPALGEGPLPRPPNACFVESAAALFRRLAVGGEADSPMLMSYYVDAQGRRLGHTVLVFGTAAGLLAIDPEVSDRPVSLPAELGVNPLALAAYLRGGPVATVRTIPMACARKAPPPGQWAALPPRPAPAG